MALFGYRRPDQIGAGYSPNARSQAIAPDMPVAAAAPPAAGMTKSGKPRGLFGRIGHSLNAFDDDPTFGDWLLGGMSRMDDLRDRKIKGQQELRAQAQMEDFIASLPPAYQPYARQFPSEMAKAMGKGLEPEEYGYSDGVSYNKRTGQAQRAIPADQSPLVLRPGDEVFERDETGRLVRDPITGMPKRLMANDRFRPPPPKVIPSDPTSNNPDLAWEK